MDRNSLLRVLAIAGALLLFWKFGMPLISGSNDTVQALPAEEYASAPGFVPDVLDPPAAPNEPNKPVEGELCKIDGRRFDATLSTRGASVVAWHLEGGKYEGMDLSTTPDHERWRSLRTLFRGPEGNDQLKFDRFPWKLEDHDGRVCSFSYEDEDVRIVKKFTAGERPFELEVATTVTNLAQEPRKHQLSIGVYAFRKNVDMKGSLGRQSPWETEVACAAGGDVVRKTKDEFKSGWFALPSSDRYAAVNSHFFTQALMPNAGPNMVADVPRCELLAEEWLAPGQGRDDDEAPTIFHAKLVYAGKELAPQASATYGETAFFGPKEREVLTHAGGSDRLKDTINLGFFRPVARVLVGFLVFLHDKVTFGNWGVAIILLTVCLRTLLFPLTFKSIKTTIAMRKLKPEVDALNEKFKDDAQAKNLAMMELWKKHGVNPFGGCLPQLVQMPVWFAMYTTLRTAVETYHVNFLWFRDLSAPDPFYILPLLLGAFMIIQQRIVPQQGMDPVQQKMMMWMMPIVFTVMMLFLPAALGVYMLTNSILGIVQQLVLEQVAPRGKPPGEIVVKQTGEKKKLQTSS
ncbi:MAG: YidC/Oxa1 family insertase periplasmic-domain containing protein [Labilithrix sp.]|nr:YidC/Oxa1 family insertase periplasmic-domain containing protein [Labilithrix sp.]MCW5818133.1 YidC/Oxa1 family insertase periplasmic-domain containing protein [Labilithrix sp.]